MYMVTCSIVLALATIVLPARCPNGGKIYASGISEQGKIDVVNMHNKYRKQIMDGVVKGQPKGKNLLTMEYDEPLGKKAVQVSKQCKMDNITATDKRWDAVGQNIYISWWSVETTEQNWKAAVTKWFNQKQNFVYPNESHSRTEDYTQLVWADSKKIGCDFIAFHDNCNLKYPHARLYTCNYGPGGNWVNEAPYELA